MHIILGILGAAVTILILLNRLSDNGIDIGWLNPFAWKRRREWAKKYHANPMFAIQQPMEVTALLMVALSKSEGEMSTEQKREIKARFQSDFHLSEEEATALVASSVFLLQDNLDQVKQMDKLLQPSLERFSEAQARSATELLNHIASFDGAPNAFQNEVIGLFNKQLNARFALAHARA